MQAVLHEGRANSIELGSKRTDSSRSPPSIIFESDGDAACLEIAPVLDDRGCMKAERKREEWKRRTAASIPSHNSPASAGARSGGHEKVVGMSTPQRHTGGGEFPTIPAPTSNLDNRLLASLRPPDIMMSGLRLRWNGHRSTWANYVRGRDARIGKIRRLRRTE